MSWGRWAAVLLGLLLAGSAQAQTAEPIRIPDGVELEGIPLGGKTAEEAEPLVRALAERKQRLPLLLRAGSRTARRTAGELGATCDVDGALAAALAAGTEGSALQRLQARWAFLGGRRIEMPLRLEASAYHPRLARVIRDWVVPPREPRLRWENGRASVIPGRAGRRLDATTTSANLQAALAGRSWQDAAKSVVEGETLEAWLARQTPHLVEVVLAPHPPRIRGSHLAALTTELARFSTHFRPGERNRSHNIRLAAAAIDGLILLPGDVFSYNETVGRRTRARGYRLAPQIVDGEMVPGIGGGVCQVSTTLYNAALLADLQIVERRHHQLPVKYVPSGRDATVADGYLDLRFRNGLARPVALNVVAEGGRLVARVIGAPECRRKVRLLRQGVRTVALRRPASDTGRAARRPPRPGHRVTLVREVRDRSGALLRREVVSRDYYRPQ